MDFEVLDIENLTTETEAAPEQVAPEPQQQQAPQQVPVIDPRQIAAEVTRNVMAGLQGVNTPQNVSAVDMKVQELLQQGWPPNIIEGMLGVQMAQHADLQKVSQVQQMEEAQKAVAVGYWEQIATVLDAYEAKFPNIKIGREALETMVHQKLYHDPAYIAERNRVDNLRLPNARSVSKAAAESIDTFLKHVTGKATPLAGKLDIGSSRPQVTSTTDGDPLSRLDQRQRKQYLTFKRTTDGSLDQKAYERALKS